MWHDVTDLRQFYRSPLGETARRLIRHRLRAMWPDLRAQRILALGYGTPYLRTFMDEAERAVAVMPAAQGVVRWPDRAPGLVALADETELPFPDNMFDRILLIHAVEFTEQLRPMLRELWRLLAGNGRLMVIVPNRRGLWARFERTPFGHGHPYSPGQLDRLLRDCMFLPTAAELALYVPPSRRLMVRLAPTWERFGRRLALPFSGVVMTEAEKNIYAATPIPHGARRLRPAVRPGGA